jgi:hypothetical protein
MPDFLLTDPGGQRFKLTVPEGVSEQDIHAVIAEQALPGEPQRRSRGDILEEGAGQLKEALAPSYLKDTPPTPESDLALADPTGKPRKIGPPSGPPTTLDKMGGVGADIASAVLPELGAAKLAMPALGMAPRQIRSHLDELNEMVRAGRMTPEQLAQARTRLGLPAESPVGRISAARPVNQQTLDEMGRVERPLAPATGWMASFEPIVNQALPGRAIDRNAASFYHQTGLDPNEGARQYIARADAADRFSVRPPGTNPDGRPVLDPPVDRLAAPPSTSPLGHGGQEFYNEHLAPHFPDQKAFVQSYFNGAYNERFEVNPVLGGLDLRGPLTLEGKKFGAIARKIDPDVKTAYHSLLEVNDKTRGGGFVKQMTANQIDLYRKMGIERVEMLANIDVGGYAWAKYGWLPDPMDWGNTAWALRDRLRRLAPDLDKDTLAVVQAHLNDHDPHAIWDLSDIKNPWQHQDWDPKINTVGKAMLSGNNWHGTLLLNDEQQMARFNDYVSQGK